VIRGSLVIFRLHLFRSLHMLYNMGNVHNLAVSYCYSRKEPSVAEVLTLNLKITVDTSELAALLLAATHPTDGAVALLSDAVIDRIREELEAAYGYQERGAGRLK